MDIHSIITPVCYFVIIITVYLSSSLCSIQLSGIVVLYVLSRCLSSCGLLEFVLVNKSFVLLNHLNYSSLSSGPKRYTLQASPDTGQFNHLSTEPQMVKRERVCVRESERKRQIYNVFLVSLQGSPIDTDPATRGLIYKTSVRTDLNLVCQS